MLRFRHISAAVCSLALTVLIPAPSAAENKGEALVESIETASDGNIKIDIPENILDLIFPTVRNTGNGQRQQKKGEAKKVNVIRSGVNRISGYRIQVFSQGHSGGGSVEARARARGSAVVARFPKYRGQVYTYSRSPNWYTRIGNFQTSAEASRALSELKRAFPQFAGEMRLVKDKIRVIAR